MSSSDQILDVDLKLTSAVILSLLCNDGRVASVCECLLGPILTSDSIASDSALVVTSIGR